MQVRSLAEPKIYNAACIVPKADDLAAYQSVLDSLDQCEPAHVHIKKMHILLLNEATGGETEITTLPSVLKKLPNLRELRVTAKARDLLSAGTKVQLVSRLYAADAGCSTHQLREILRARNLTSTGTKDELCRRIASHDAGFLSARSVANPRKRTLEQAGLAKGAARQSSE